VDFQTFVLNQTHDDVWNGVDAAVRNMKVRVFGESCAPLNDGDDKIAICAEMAKAHPTDSEAQLQYVVALANFFHAQEAWTQLQNLEALHGERPHAYDVVGAAMLNASQFEPAGRLYARATELWPHDPLMVYRLGRARLGLHQIGPAYESFTAAIRDDSSYVDAHTYAAVVSAQQARLDETRQHCAIVSRELARLLVERAGDVDAWLGLAFCASVYGRHQEAVADFARASLISSSRALATSELLDMINSSYALVGEQPPAPLPHR
jgi:tetratricopeptide (TPR) repeat protein